jgi:hypothetical protein
MIWGGLPKGVWRRLVLNVCAVDRTLGTGVGMNNTCDVFLAARSFHQHYIFLRPSVGMSPRHAAVRPSGRCSGRAVPFRFRTVAASFLFNL